MSLSNLKKEMDLSRNPEKAKLLSGYFKTGKGEDGDGDIFFGIIVPNQRKIAKNHSDLTLNDLQNLLSSNIHEYRLTALFILVDKYQKADDSGRKEIVNFYLKNTKNINNWDLVDLSAPRILGDYLIDKNRSILYRLAKSHHLWEKRIAVLATFMFIKNHQFKDSLKIAEILMNDRHDLIHKAVGWMLREIGKIDKTVEKNFLKKHCKNMPRTMLRYAIEKFSKKERKFYLNKE